AIPGTFALASADTLISIENVIGTNGPDLIVGNEMDNTLDGRNGNDILDGGLGNDTLIGGPGTDTALFASHDALTGELGTISLGANGNGTATYYRLIGVGGAQVPLVVETDTLQGIENVTGSSLPETISGNSQDNVLDGGSGSDTLDGGLGNDTLIGGSD